MIKLRQISRVSENITAASKKSRLCITSYSEKSVTGTIEVGLENSRVLNSLTIQKSIKKKLYGRRPH